MPHLMVSAGHHPLGALAASAASSNICIITGDECWIFLFKGLGDSVFDLSGGSGVTWLPLCLGMVSHPPFSPSIGAPAVHLQRVHLAPCTCLVSHLRVVPSSNTRCQVTSPPVTRQSLHVSCSQRDQTTFPFSLALVQDPSTFFDSFSPPATTTQPLRSLPPADLITHLAFFQRVAGLGSPYPHQAEQLWQSPPLCSCSALFSFSSAAGTGWETLTTMVALPSTLMPPTKSSEMSRTLAL